MKNILFLLTFPLILFSYKPNIILISIDTLNVKRTNLFDYKENTTPFLKKLSKKGILLKNSFTITPLTLPSHSTLLTGIFPHNLGVYDNLNSYLSKEFKTISEILKERGYNTRAVVSSYILSSNFGLSQGFDFYDEISFEELKGGTTIIPERNARETTDIVIKDLKNLKKPFFLFIHYFDPHIPYIPPEDFKKRFKDPYDGEAAFVDFQIERLFNSFKDIKDCWVFIVSDHGEGLGENDEDTHGYFLYKTTMQILTMIIPPEGEKLNINNSRLTSIADIFPTILKILKIEIKEKIDGIDVFQERNSFLPLETLYGYFHHNFMPLRGITKGNIWYIFNFDKENRDFNKVLKELFKNYKEPIKYFKSFEDKELSSLGYLKGPSKEIPKMEKWKDFKSPYEKKEFIRKIIKIFEEKNIFEKLKELERDEPGDPEVLKLLGDYYKKNNNFKKSIEYYEKSLKKSPFYFEIYLNLSQSYLKLNKFNEALINIENYLKFIKDDSIGYYYKGLILDETGKTEEAVKFYKISIEKGFLTQEVFIKISLSLIKLKREKEAEEMILRYLKDKKSAPLFYLLGNIYKGKDKEKAKNYYYEAINLMPNFLPPYIDLADILEIKEGKEILKRALNIDPSFDVLWEKLGDIYLKGKENKKALECYNKALEHSREKERLKKKIKEIEFE